MPSGTITEAEIFAKMMEYVNDARRFHSTLDRDISNLIGKSGRVNILGNRIIDTTLASTRQKMILHNCSDKFLRLHERQIRNALRDGGGSPKWVVIRLKESSSAPSDYGRGVDYLVYQIVHFELVTKDDPATGDIVLTPQSEADLATIEAWETRNEATPFNQF